MRAVIDVRGEVCPMTYVRVKLKLDALAEGDELEIWLRGPEASRNVPRSAREEGHQVLSMTEQAGGERRVLLRKQSTRSEAWR